MVNSHSEHVVHPGTRPLRAALLQTPDRVGGHPRGFDSGLHFGSAAMHPAQLPCWITHTNERTHEIIRGGLDRSPMYTGKIEGVGPRYCPSIEDKIHRFADKNRHLYRARVKVVSIFAWVMPTTHFLVALGTIADLVPLTGENRILVQAGLRRLNATHRPGLVALRGVAVADFDHDGYSDLFVTYWGHNVLYRNNGNGGFASIDLRGLGTLRHATGHEIEHGHPHREAVRDLLQHARLRAVGHRRSGASATSSRAKLPRSPTPSA